MKKTIPVFFFIFFSFNNNAQTIYFPKYETVVTEFYNRYSDNALCDSCQLAFAKKADGWHVYTHGYISKKAIIDELFWSKKKQKYISINFPKFSSTNKYKKSLLQNRWNDSWWGPYYGYVGWEKELIRDFANKENLNDTLWYTLGRAYSSYSQALINGQYDYADLDSSFNIKDGPNGFTESQLKKWREFTTKAKEAYYKAYELNPKLECLVGEIKLKHDDEYLYNFLSLRIYQGEEEAARELRNGLFDPIYIKMATIYLESCDSNAILFTNGDNDTYPLLYAQKQLGIRKDILTVNLSLLNTSPYINSLRRKIEGTDPLKLSLTPEQYKNGTRDIISISEKDADTIGCNLEELIQFISSDAEDHKILVSNGEAVNYLPSKKICIRNENSNIEFTLSDNYILKNKLIVLDILNENFGKRPIYWAITVGSDAYIGLEDYFQLEGLAFKLTTNTKTSNDGYTGMVNTAVMYKKLMRFDYGITDTIMKHTTAYRMCMNYRNNIARLASALIQENKFDSARNVLMKSIKEIPNEFVAYDYFMLPIAESFYEINAEYQAERILEIMIDNYIQIITRGLENDTKTSQLLKALAQRTITTASKYSTNQEFKNNITSKCDKILIRLDNL